MPKKLGDVLILEYGKPLPANRRSPTGSVPAFGANGVKCRTDDVYFDQPSIIVGRKGSAGALTLTDGAFWPLDVTYFVRHDESQYGLRFLFYLLRSLDPPALAKGVKPGLNRNEVYAIERLFPDKPEQEQIAAILDEAFAAIETATANSEKNLGNAQEIFDQRLQMLAFESQSWPQVLLGDVSLDFGRGRSRDRPRNAPELYGGPYPLIQTGDVRVSNHWITDHSQAYSEAGLAQSKLWPVGTVCITIAANIAESGILTFDSCFPDSVIGVVTDPTRMNNEFLEYVLQAKRELLQGQGQGAAQDNINLGTFEAETFPVPELSVQEAHVQSLSTLAGELDRLTQICETRKRALDDLDTSLLAWAFSGRLKENEGESDPSTRVAAS